MVMVMMMMMMIYICDTWFVKHKYVCHVNNNATDIKADNANVNDDIIIVSSEKLFINVNLFLCNVKKCGNVNIIIYMQPIHKYIKNNIK